MRIWLVVMLVVLVPEGAMAARWSKAEVPVWVFASDEWRPGIQRVVDDFNANLPPTAPRLRLIEMGELRCDKLPSTGKPGGISICEPERIAQGQVTVSDVVGGRFTSARIALMPNPYGRPIFYDSLICHELTHAVFDSPDDTSLPHPNDSCVQGTLDHLGSWDIAYAASVYRAHGHHSRSRHRAHH